MKIPDYFKSFLALQQNENVILPQKWNTVDTNVHISLSTMLLKQYYSKDEPTQ